ncbi:hypothetical protein C2869_06200 [Saccharobesus litoralis]|uniref:ABC transporter substrate-binding protein n=1 Tax=Saccharobesus litoralis TaxID=2172099 RepID=A0A2S0VPC3_9ALTE|nr:extracellular solute-binding protein [Saccharobesus litoralis]AWB66054.1 hypothetical protein C2869_06200 [Saccharobesus litoralis]
MLILSGKCFLCEITVRQIFLLISLLMIAVFSHAAEQPKIKIWYQKEQAAAVFFEQQMQIASEKLGIEIELTYLRTTDLKTALVKALMQNTPPDLVLAPSDFISDRNIMGFSQVNPNDFALEPIANNVWLTVTANQHIYGIPLSVGNHLVMYYNRDLVQQPIKNWAQLKSKTAEIRAKGVEPIGWNYNEMYWFFAFTTAFDANIVGETQVYLNTPAMAQALRFYRSLEEQNIIDRNCDYDCSFKRFMEGKVAYSINGDWAFKDFKQALGEKLGVSQLPYIDDKPMKAYFSSICWLFPNQSHNSSKRLALTKLVNYTLAPTFQEKMSIELGAISVLSQIQAESGQQLSAQYQALVSQLSQSIPIPPQPSISAAWSGMRKGFDLYWRTKVSAERAAKVMQIVAERELVILNQQKAQP